MCQTIKRYQIDAPNPSQLAAVPSLCGLSAKSNSVCVAHILIYMAHGSRALPSGMLPIMVLKMCVAKVRTPVHKKSWPKNM
jgi:hypothetical protein